MMKNRMMPVRMSPKASLRPKSVAISLAPRSRNTMRKLVSTMKTGLNLASQADHDGGEAAVGGERGGYRVVGAGHEQEAGEAAERAGDDHGAHNDALDLYADVAGRALALADDGYLIAVLGVLEVDVHEHGEQATMSTLSM